MRSRSAAAVFLLAGCAAPAARVVASGLDNPRGVLRLADDSILLAEAGTGRPGSGRLIRLSGGERTVVVKAQPSVNILGRIDVHRDEIFGFADVAEGGGMILATVADPVEGTRVLRIDGGTCVEWTRLPGNANSIVHHPGLDRWFAVSSFANTLVEFGPEKRREVVRFPPLEAGQDAVPAALAVEPSTGALLVALFSGQVGGDTGGTGVDFVRGSGRVVRVDPARRTVEVVARDLNAPVDLAVAGDALYVLEFCDRFVGPIEEAELGSGRDCHGGFERFSGRLLRISLATGERRVIARGLDLPTNLHVAPGGRILVTEGQGTPGRAIPGPGGPTRVEGRLIELRDTP
jgi:hypothetical protein